MAASSCCFIPYVFGLVAINNRLKPKNPDTDHLITLNKMAAIGALACCCNKTVGNGLMTISSVGTLSAIIETCRLKNH